MSFAFLPRKVVKSNTQQQQTASTSKVPTTSATEIKPIPNRLSHNHHHGSSQRRKAPSETPAEELSRLTELALSDYAISQNQEISMKLQDGEDGCELNHPSNTLTHSNIHPRHSTFLAATQIPSVQASRNPTFRLSDSQSYSATCFRHHGTSYGAHGAFTSSVAKSTRISHRRRRRIRSPPKTTLHHVP
jgi:hypothetical protein